MVVIAYHTGDAFVNDDGTQRKNFYGITATPVIKLDGTFEVRGGIHTGTMYPVYRNYYDTRRQVPSPLDIELTTTYDSTSRQGRVDFTIHNPGGSAVSGQLQVVVTEDIAYPWQGMDSLYGVERDMLPDATGEPVSVPAGDSVVGYRDFAIDPGWLARNCRVIAFIQNNSTREIYQGAWAGIRPQPRPAYDAHQPVRPVPGADVDLTIGLRNVGNIAAQDVDAVLSTTDPYLTVTAANGSFGDIARAATAYSTTPYQIHVADSCPDQYLAELSLAVTSANGPPTSTALRLWVTSTPGIFDNIEYGEHGWTHSGTRDQWHITTFRSQSPVHSWYSGSESNHQYTNENDARLVTPWFTVDSLTSMSFQHWYGTEANYDYCMLEINNGSEFWQHLASYTGNSSGWEEASFDLTSHRGQALRARFRFLSDYNVTAEGWYVDDFRAGTMTGIAGPREPIALYLRSNRNPVRGTAEISYQLLPGITSSVKVYDAGGRFVREVAADLQGRGKVTWNLEDASGRAVRPGTYFARLAGDQAVTKLVVTR